MCNIVRHILLSLVHSAHPDPIQKLMRVYLLNDITVIVAYKAASSQRMEQLVRITSLSHMCVRMQRRQVPHSVQTVQALPGGHLQNSIC